MGPSVGGVIGGKFYVMGQSPYTHDARFAVYDPATNQWTAKNPAGPVAARRGVGGAGRQALRHGWQPVQRDN